MRVVWKTLVVCVLLSWTAQSFASDAIVARKKVKDKIQMFSGTIDSFQDDVLIFKIADQGNAATLWGTTPETTSQALKNYYKDYRNGNWRSLQWNVKDWVITLKLNDHGTQTAFDGQITNSYDGQQSSRDLLGEANDAPPKSAEEVRQPRDLTTCRTRGYDVLHLNQDARPVRFGKILSISDGRLEFQEEQQSVSKIFLSEELSSVALGECVRR